MPVGTYRNYFNRLKKMRANIFINGEKVGRRDERLQGGLYVIRQTYDCTNEPVYEDVCVATSHLTGERINRYTHINQTQDDLLKKQMTTRLLCHRVGGCIQRCMGVDALNALSVATYEMDSAFGTRVLQAMHQVPGIFPGQRPLRQLRPD